MRTGSGKQAAKWAPFKGVNTMLGNIKAAIMGTYRQPSPALQPPRPARHDEAALPAQRRPHPAAPYRLLIAEGE